jgi:hypothetical protein
MIFADILPAFFIKRIALCPGGLRGRGAQLDITIRNLGRSSLLRVPQVKNYIKIYVLQVGSKDLRRRLLGTLARPESRFQWTKTSASPDNPRVIDALADEILTYIDFIAQLESAQDAYQHKIIPLADILDNIDSTYDDTRFIEKSLIGDKAFQVTFSEDDVPSFEGDPNFEGDLSYFCFAHLDVNQVMIDYNIKDLYSDGLQNDNLVGTITHLNQISSNLAYDIAFRDGVVPTESRLFFLQGTSTPFIGETKRGTPPAGAVASTTIAAAGDSPRAILTGASIQWFGRSGPIGSREFNIPLDREIRAYNKIEICGNDDVGEERDPDRAGIGAQEGASPDPAPDPSPSGLQGFIEIATPHHQGSRMAQVVMGVDYYGAIIQNSAYRDFLENNTSTLIKKRVLHRSKIIETEIGRTSELPLPGELQREVAIVAQTRDVSDEEFFGRNENIGVRSRQVDYYTAMSLTFSGEIPLQGGTRVRANGLFKRLEESPLLLDRILVPTHNIQEVDLQGVESDAQALDYRYFMIHDYEYANVHSGLWKYKIAIEFEDRTKELIQEYLDNLRQSIAALSTLVAEIQLRYWDQFTLSWTAEYIQLLRDQLNNHEFYDQTPTPHLIVIDKAIWDYVGAKAFVGLPGNSSEEELSSSLLRVADPTSNASLVGMNEFLSLMRTLETQLVLILNSTGDPDRPTGDANGAPRLIQVAKTYNEIIDASARPIKIDYQERYENPRGSF